MVSKITFYYGKWVSNFFRLHFATFFRVIQPLTSDQKLTDQKSVTPKSYL